MTFILDTGYEGGLTLPNRIIQILGLEPIEISVRQLADGSLHRVSAYELLIEIEDEEQLVSILEMESAPLLGTEFLRGCLVQIDVNEGGEVTVERQ